MTVMVMAATGVVAAVLLRDGQEPGNGSAGRGSPVAQSSPAARGCGYRPSTGGEVTDVGTPPPGSPAMPAGATIRTGLGTLKLELDAEKAPCAVNSLAHLAGQRYYDGTECHRLTTHPALKILQCGDPSGTGTGGPGYQFDNENTAGVRYTRGTVAMANAGPDTNGSHGGTGRAVVMASPIA